LRFSTTRRRQWLCLQLEPFSTIIFQPSSIENEPTALTNKMKLFTLLAGKFLLLWLLE